MGYIYMYTQEVNMEHIHQKQIWDGFTSSKYTWDDVNKLEHQCHVFAPSLPTYPEEVVHGIGHLESGMIRGFHLQG